MNHDRHIVGESVSDHGPHRVTGPSDRREWLFFAAVALVVAGHRDVEDHVSPSIDRKQGGQKNQPGFHDTDFLNRAMSSNRSPWDLIHSASLSHQASARRN